MSFRILIDMEVMEFSERLPKRIRDTIKIAIRSIHSDPQGQSDAEDYDEIGRLLNIKIVGEFALTYWIDHSDKQIKILDIHSADR